MECEQCHDDLKEYPMIIELYRHGKIHNFCCDECGENDQILAEFDTYKDGENAIRAQHYNPDYRDEMIRRLYKTVD